MKKEDVTEVDPLSLNTEDTPVKKEIIEDDQIVIKEEPMDATRFLEQNLQEVNDQNLEEENYQNLQGGRSVLLTKRTT